MDDTIERPIIDFDRAKTMFDNVLEAQLRESNIDPRMRLTESVDVAVNNAIDVMRNRPVSELSLRSVADALADAAISAMKRGRQAGSTAVQQLDALRGPLIAKLQSALVDIRTAPARLSVLVTSAQLREAGTSTIQLDMSLDENGVEWTTLDPDDPASARLVPE
jgi:hypothetical protein